MLVRSGDVVVEKSGGELELGVGRSAADDLFHEFELVGGEGRLFGWNLCRP
jgi:hypothetical protein